MFAFVFNLSVSLRIDRSFVANASIGADRHVSGSVARATMQAFFSFQRALYRQRRHLRINPELLCWLLLLFAFFVAD